LVTGGVIGARSIRQNEIVEGKREKNVSGTAIAAGAWTNDSHAKMGSMLRCITVVAHEFRIWNTDLHGQKYLNLRNFSMSDESISKT
jgi:hypothetical protein